MAELSATLSNEELAEWMAYYNIDPWGGYRSDIQTAKIEAGITSYTGSLYDILSFNPNPLPAEQIEKRAKAAQIAKLERETQQMAKMFDVA
ncbi:phage tail assembly protein T [Psychrobacter arcticus]|nr:phage tail protein [Psychrobacter arcticus]